MMTGPGVFFRVSSAIVAGLLFIALDAGRAVAGLPGHCVPAPGYPCSIPVPQQQVQTRPYAETSAFERAHIHFDRKEWAEARKDYEEALGYCYFDCDYLHHNIAVVSSNQANREGNYWHKHKDFDLAISAYQRALTTCRADMKCQYIRNNIASARRAAMNEQGYYYRRIGNWEAAIAEYLAALKSCRRSDDCDYLRRNLTRAKYGLAMYRAENADTHFDEMLFYRDALYYCHIGDNCGWVQEQMRLSEEAHVLGNARRQMGARLSAARSLTYTDRPSDRGAYFGRLVQAENEIARAISDTRALWGSKTIVPVNGEDRAFFFEECCRRDIRNEIVSLVEALGELWHRYQYQPAREALDRIMRTWGAIDELQSARMLIPGAFLRELQDLEARNRKDWSKQMVSDLSSIGRSDIAINRIRVMLEAEPRNHSLWTQLAKLEKAQGDWVAVVETRKMIYSLLGGSAALNNLANAYDKVGEHEKARATFETALRVDPDNFTVLANLAANIARNDPLHIDDAADLYARALAIEPEEDERAFYERVKKRAARLEELRGNFKTIARRVIWPVANSNSARSLGALTGTIEGAVSAGFDAAFGGDPSTANLDQVKLASHYGGLAARKTGEISKHWQAFYLAEKAGEAPHFLASQVFDRGRSGTTQIGGIDAVDDIEGRPVGGDIGARLRLPDEVAEALQKEPEWIEMAVQEQALGMDLKMHQAKLESLETRAEAPVDAVQLEDIKVQIDEAKQDIKNTAKEQKKVVKKMASFAIDFSERKPAPRADQEGMEQ